MSGFPSPRGPCTAAGGSGAGGALALPCLGASCFPQRKGGGDDTSMGAWGGGAVTEGGNPQTGLAAWHFPLSKAVCFNLPDPSAAA